MQELTKDTYALKALIVEMMHLIHCCMYVCIEILMS